MILLDGKKISLEGQDVLKARIKDLGFSPTLAIVQVGKNERSDAYIQAKIKFASAIGAKVMVREFDESTDEQKLFFEIDRLNKDRGVNGIIVQLPVPEQYNRFNLIESIDPEKDVDGLTSKNLKKLLENTSGILPATAKGVLSLLQAYKIDVTGKKVVVVGRSIIAGKSIALLLLNNNATVTVCHSRSSEISEATKNAEIIVSAVGRPKFINKDYLGRGQIIVDVGISVISGEKLEEEVPGKTIVGDVDFEYASKVAEAISPVPGGVGPMTVLSLFENLIRVSEIQNISR
jgi:methylenetetrahydrofolate dehydrogenase (NADP+)/methenyltetrahydrofolate cyclohydrolase